MKTLPKSLGEFYISIHILNTSKQSTRAKLKQEEQEEINEGLKLGFML